MFEYSVTKELQGKHWGALGAISALAVLLVAGYFLIMPVH